MEGHDRGGGREEKQYIQWEWQSTCTHAKGISPHLQQEDKDLSNFTYTSNWKSSKVTWEGNKNQRSMKISNLSYLCFIRDNIRSNENVNHILLFRIQNFFILVIKFRVNQIKAYSTLFLKKVYAHMAK